MISEQELRQWPYVRLLLPFVAGILFQSYLSLPCTGTLVLFALSTVSLFIVFAWQNVSPDYHRRWFFGVTLNIMLFFFGCSLLSIKENRGNFTHYGMRESQIIAVVTEVPEEKPRSYKAILKVRQIKSPEGWENTRGSALVYFEKDSAVRDLFIGDQLKIEGEFQEIPFYNNPYEFDYRRYLYRRGIYCRMYLRSEDWERTAANKGNTLQLISAKMRHRLLGIYQKFHFGEEEMAIAGALTLGFRDKLDDNLQDLYKNAGVMHVLAISGLHVGILYFLLFYLLGFLGKFRSGTIIRASLIIMFLWFFAFLTGLSPSVMRAATMFSFVTIGQSLKRPGNVYNTIAASAFFLLLINPYLIMEVGFQLSYIAVTGIIFFQPRFYRLFRSRFWVVDKAWGLISVSLAAQLSTFPITIYYFHQFPNYFIISNFVVIPFVTVILYLGVLLFLFSFLPPVAALLAWLMNQSISILNNILELITGLPHALTSGISNSILETLLIYSIILALSLFLIRKKSRYIFCFFTAVALFLSINAYSIFHTKHQKVIAVYHVEKTTAIGFITGEKAWLSGDFDTTGSQENVLYYVSNHFNRLRIRHWNCITLEEHENEMEAPDLTDMEDGPVISGNFIWFHGRRICLIDGEWPDRHPEKTPYDLDCVIIRHDPEIPHDGFFEHFRVRQIVLDPSISFYWEEVMKEKCVELEIPCYVVRTEGAWIRNINEVWL